jgi:hypothetical protein
VRLEEIGKLKNPMTLGIELATFRLVAKCLNQLRYRVLPVVSSMIPKQKGKAWDGARQNFTDTKITISKVKKQSDVDHNLLQSEFVPPG